jgi:hypothetical protein
MPINFTKYTRIRNRNRFFRVILYRHIRDLKIIALLATLFVTLVIVLWGRILFSSLYTNDLDQALESFYAYMDCIEINYEKIGDKLVDPLEKARMDLVTARTKIQNVNNNLWDRIERSSTLLQNATSVAACSHDLSEAQTANIKTQIPTLTPYVRHLASTLANTGTTFSAWAVVGVFGTVFLTFGGWLYRTGDTRMTAIDVVASEIFSICRAITNNRSIHYFGILPKRNCAAHISISRIA